MKGQRSKAMYSHPKINGRIFGIAGEGTGSIALCLRSVSECSSSDFDQTFVPILPDLKKVHTSGEKTHDISVWIGIYRDV